MTRYFYSDTISQFLGSSAENILGILSANSRFSDELTQKDAWRKQIDILQISLVDHDGWIFFEYSVPRMGRRIDVVLIIRHVLFILEFKVGETHFALRDSDQVWDYALDLKHFHETSHNVLVAPILVATEANDSSIRICKTHHDDNLLMPIKSNPLHLKGAIENVLKFEQGSAIDSIAWASGRYSPTPTIIEAAIALFSNHSVSNIARTDASAKNLSDTSNCISEIITDAKRGNEKVICFVTGVPGAGKTLVGLDIATKNLNSQSKTSSVFLSGNGPLVDILREALTRDKVKREKEKGQKIRKSDVLREVKLFIQNVHHYRDAYLSDLSPPFDHIAIFDEAQRAWNQEQTASFMKRKKNQDDFSFSEPEFLISCLDRHPDWAVIICLVGGGQEINTGEAGISEWIKSVNRSFPHWKVYVSSRLSDSEYAAGHALELLKSHQNTFFKDQLHLSVSMRSFRAEHLSHLVKCILDLELNVARRHFHELRSKYPITLTRDLSKAKQWLKDMARGSERYGIVVSSQAQRLKPHAIDVKSVMDPVHWFLNEKDDVRSSYYLEDVATEFVIQGLELDWACITWDGDFRFTNEGWQTFEFKGNTWQRISKEERKLYLKNAYRVLLTRARQGMVIVVPNGDSVDHTRRPEFYDSTFEYLKSIGFEVL